MPDTPTQQLLDIKLDGGLNDFVHSRRDRGASWRRISLDIRDEVGVDVTHETLRSWFPDSVAS